MSFLRILVCVAPVLSGCGGGCSPNGPSEDVCNAPGSASLASLDIMREADSGYVPVQDGEVFPLVFGSQGAPMLLPYLRVTGSVPGCLGQQTTVRTFDGELVNSDQQPRSTFDQGDGSYMTKGIFLPIEYNFRGNYVRMTVAAGTLVVERQFYIENNTTPDATEWQADTGVPDAQLPDAALAIDASPADALTTDAPP